MTALLFLPAVCALVVLALLPRMVLSKPRVARPTPRAFPKLKADRLRDDWTSEHGRF